jgi:TolB-like protein
MEKTCRMTSTSVFDKDIMVPRRAQAYFSDGLTEELIAELGRRDGSG